MINNFAVESTEGRSKDGIVEVSYEVVGEEV